MRNIGFIGLGIMGKPMCRNLLKAGYGLTVFSRAAANVEAVTGHGAKYAPSPAEVAKASELVITMLPDSPQVREVVLGENGVLHGASPGLYVVDMSSIAPLASREIGAELAKAGVRFLDAPVSGGEPKAVEGTLTVMAGGDAADFEAVRPVLSAMAASVTRVGEVGAGGVAKLANQIVVALNIAAMSEALVLAAKAGVEPELVYQAIRGGLAGSTVLDAKAPLVMDRKFDPGFRIRLHVKDLANVMQTANNLHVPLPLTASVMEIMQALLADGCGEDDHGGIIRYFEKLAHVTVSR
ncbi:2-hydroxy-3-oxopropionate reductase [Solidesulfovibrio sp.]|uniref:2-hydroxy-3-oxopropionate reductase n=1 Tax=Solidesulfovibrio sp. TaxID=2910990 RepID=UPI002B2034FB|nr:2-hydroxy-3-oxopropionate reductase [Solidesulfovibrio sp.]MEA4854965.1 2-hydroxy-3-oxopropionate reductase [Solidesulfovibrio sp.]